MQPGGNLGLVLAAGPTLVVATAHVGDSHVIGSCEDATKKIIHTRSAATP